MHSLGATLAERYRLERELGAGGMATVYLAEDLRHHRRVAIKVLHPELSAILGPERFLKEIELTANLQHPHILPLFDSGSADGRLYYVMPFVEGETLRSRLERERQLPIGDSLRIATEVADALQYAHKHGIVHRDIKPENVLLHDGHALVADFGIALAVEQAGGTRMTQTGLSLGTPQYMSPEQAMGERHVDARTDVYALGVVTYEMLAGAPPFTGPNAQAIVAQVLTTEPPLPSTHRKSIPESADAAVERALAKLPADRFSSAAEFAVALTADAPRGVVTRSRPRAHGRNRVLWGALGVALVVAASGWWSWYRASRSPRQDAPPSRLALLTPLLGGNGTGGMHRQLTVTPDGSAVIFSGGALNGAGGTLNVQRLDADSAIAIPGSNITYAPSVSPDGRWIAARDVAGNAVLLPATGSPQGARPLTLGGGFTFYAWHPDGTLWLTRPPFTSLERIRPSSDSVQRMLGPMRRGVWLQQILDDGRTAIVIDRGSGVVTGPCALLDLRSGAITPLISTDIVAARYTDGYLVWATADGILSARAFDTGSHRLVGRTVVIASNVSITGAGDAQFDVARNGTVVYAPEQPRSLVLVDRSGTSRPLTDQGGNFHMPRFSPDGHHLTVDFETASGRDVWLLDLIQKTLTRVTFDHDGHDATWMPDGSALTYSSARSGTLGIYRVKPGSMAPAESLFVSPALNFTGEWLPDASGLVTVAVDLQPGTHQDLAVVGNGGRGPLAPLLVTKFREYYPALSHDGRWLAFVSDASGRDEVYVRPFAGTGATVQVSQGGGDEPAWSRSGGELFYRGLVNGIPTLVSARIRTDGGDLSVAGRTGLFSVTDYLPTTPHTNYDVSPDGTGFAMVRRNPTSRIVVLQNLPALVQQLAGRDAPAVQ